MANDVFANGREIACKAADGKAVAAFPDVCLTPPQTPGTPPGVPIPYPNTALAKDTTKGSKTVKISGKEVMLKNRSHFKTSTGDEAGSTPKKGFVTSKIKGKAYFNAWSMNVKVEGQNAVRHLDITTHNHSDQPGQTPPWPYMDSMATSEDPCEKEKEAEGTACKNYRPAGKEDVCKEMGLMDPIEEFKSDKKAIARGYKGVADWSDKISGRAASKSKKDACNCLRARRCKLVPYDAQKDGIDSCCPSQTGHHLIPKASLKGISGYGKGKKAPCICVEGANHGVGTHGMMHKVQSYSAWMRKTAVAKGKAKPMTLGGVAKAAAGAVRTVFPESGCSDKCITAQLLQYHDRDIGISRDKQISPPATSHPSVADARMAIQKAKALAGK